MLNIQKLFTENIIQVLFVGVVGVGIPKLEEPDVNYVGDYPAEVDYSL